MDKYTVNFSKVKHYIEIHEALKCDLDFPDYYGGNTDALWDCLTDMLGDPCHIEIIGFEVVRQEFKNEWESVIRIFKKAKHAYNDMYSNSFIVILVHEDGSREEIK